MLYCRLANPFLDTSAPINGYRRLYTVCGIISQVIVVYQVDGYERKNYPYPEYTLCWPTAAALLPPPDRSSYASGMCENGPCALWPTGLRDSMTRIWKSTKKRLHIFLPNHYIRYASGGNNSSRTQGSNARFSSSPGNLRRYCPPNGASVPFRLCPTSPQGCHGAS